MIYAVVQMIGLWKSSDKYSGLKLWAILAKISVVLGSISLVIGSLALIGLLSQL